MSSGLCVPGGTNPFTAGGDGGGGFPGGGGGYGGGGNGGGGYGGGGNGGGYNYASLKTANPHNPFLQYNNNEEKLRLDTIATEKYAAVEKHDYPFMRRNFKVSATDVLLCANDSEASLTRFNLYFLESSPQLFSCMNAADLWHWVNGQAVGWS